MKTFHYIAFITFLVSALLLAGADAAERCGFRTCRENEYCLGNGPMNFCRPKGNEGASCRSDDQCAEGLTCVDGSCTGELYNSTQLPTSPEPQTSPEPPNYTENAIIG